MKKIIIIILLSILTLGCKKEQNNKSFYLKYLELVLSEEKTGKVYKIKQDLKDKVNEYEAIYLGELNVESSKYQIIYSIGYFGNSQSSVSANSVLTIFDEANILIGFYSLGGKLENHPFIKGNVVIFPSDKLNKCIKTNKIDFGKGIPKELFLECKDEMGNISNFQEPNKFDNDINR